MPRIDHFFCAERADSLSPGSKMSEGFGGIARERSVSQTGQDFGANDWLVEEMFERYQQDPTSIPTEWVTYFQNNPQGGSSGNSNGVSPNGAASTNPSALAGAPRGGTPPTPKTVTPPNISLQGSTQGSAVPAAPSTPAQAVAPAQPATTPAQAAAPAQPAEIGRAHV